MLRQDQKQELEEQGCKVDSVNITESIEHKKLITGISQIYVITCKNKKQ